MMQALGRKNKGVVAHPKSRQSMQLDNTNRDVEACVEGRDEVVMEEEKKEREREREEKK